MTAEGKEWRGGREGKGGGVDMQALADVTWLCRPALINQTGCDAS